MGLRGEGEIGFMSVRPLRVQKLSMAGFIISGLKCRDPDLGSHSHCRALSVTALNIQLKNRTRA